MLAVGIPSWERGLSLGALLEGGGNAGMEGVEGQEGVVRGTEVALEKLAIDRRVSIVETRVWLDGIGCLSLLP